MPSRHVGLRGRKRIDVDGSARYRRRHRRRSSELRRDPLLNRDCAAPDRREIGRMRAIANAHKDMHRLHVLRCRRVLRRSPRHAESSRMRDGKQRARLDLTTRHPS